MELKHMKKIFVILIILNMLTSYSYAIKDDIVQNKPAKPNINRKQNINEEVLNIVIDRFDNQYIYSKDGRQFQINNQTVIIDNSRTTESKIRTAELFFRQNVLVTIVIK